jgi:curved DNA-binding protein CbpA
MYYRLARECHPDKHPDDPEASAKFQALGDAYQVLGDPQRRERYDLNGKSALDDMPVVESKVIFVMLFGAEEFEPFVGRVSF